jgi:hypothetical protein
MMVYSMGNAGPAMKSDGTGQRNTRSTKGICMMDDPVKEMGQYQQWWLQ